MLSADPSPLITLTRLTAQTRHGLQVQSAFLRIISWSTSVAAPSQACSTPQCGILNYSNTTATCHRGRRDASLHHSYSAPTPADAPPVASIAPLTLNRL